MLYILLRLSKLAVNISYYYFCLPLAVKCTPLLPPLSSQSPLLVFLSQHFTQCVIIRWVLSLDQKFFNRRDHIFLMVAQDSGYQHGLWTQDIWHLIRALTFTRQVT